MRRKTLHLNGDHRLGQDVALRCHCRPAQRDGSPRSAEAPPDRFGLFEPIIGKATGEYLPEDLAFCRR